jgi:multicomponent Na+:H+ antiporter subunit C
MTLAIAVGVLVAAGVFLLTRRGLLRLVLGFVLLGHAVNLVLLAAGGTSRREPALIGPELDLQAAADPLPQAFVLTAIVITFGVTVYLLGLIARSGPENTDAPQPDVSRDEQP